MPRDPAMLSEIRAIQAAIAPFPTLAALEAWSEWPRWERRLAAILDAPRRYDPLRPPAPPRDPATLRAVQWNIEHGNWYEHVERALLRHPQLAGADLLTLNEIDLGMARAGNRDVTADLVAALGLYGVWVPLFVENTLGRDDDATTAAGRANEESLFGLGILSRHPLGEVRIVPLPGPRAIQFDLERMLGGFKALVVEVLRPGAPFVAVSVHLEVHRTRRHRTEQMVTLMRALERERRSIVLAGDWNTHTFDRGLWHSPISGALPLLAWPGGALRRRLRYPDRGAHRETLFDALREAGFEWDAFNDREPTLGVRFDRLDETNVLPPPVRAALRGTLAWAEGRGQLRLDWIAGRGWRGGRGLTVPGLDGRGRASDHAPIVGEFVT